MGQEKEVMPMDALFIQAVLILTFMYRLIKKDR
jgi:hypothetical protein